MMRDMGTIVMIALSYAILSLGFIFASVAVGIFFGSGFGFAVMALYFFASFAFAALVAVEAIRGGKDE